MLRRSGARCWRGGRGRAGGNPRGPPSVRPRSHTRFPARRGRLQVRALSRQRAGSRACRSRDSRTACRWPPPTADPHRSRPSSRPRTRWARPGRQARRAPKQAHAPGRRRALSVGRLGA
eukprot:3013062-Prymnesium_polylepis.1